MYMYIRGKHDARSARCSASPSCCAASSCARAPLQRGCPTLEKLQYEQYHHDYHNDDYQRAYHLSPPLLAKFPHEAWQRKGRDPVEPRPDSILFYFRRFLTALMA